MSRTPARKPGHVRVVLRHETGSKVERPSRGDHVIFSVHSTKGGHWLQLPEEVPWTHRAEIAEPRDLEPDEDWR